MEILFEDNHLIAVNKPCGMLVQGDKTQDLCLLDEVKAYLKRQYKKPGNVFCGTIHRIDRPVSGLVLFAKTSKSLERMNKIFAERQVQKTYWAVVENSQMKNEDRVQSILRKNEQKNIVSVKPFFENMIMPPEYKYAELSFNNFGNAKPNWSIFDVYPKTGRSHQIRAQLSQIQCPILGDVKYGSNVYTDGKSICLHSRKLQFIHPVNNVEIVIEGNPPKNKWYNLFKHLY